MSKLSTYGYVGMLVALLISILGVLGLWEELGIDDAAFAIFCVIGGVSLITTAVGMVRDWNGDA